MAETPENKPENQIKPADNKVFLPRTWPYRIIGNLIILGFIFFIASITITIKNSLVSKKITDLRQQFYDYSGTIGFTIDDIILEGRNKTSKQAILNTLNLNRESNILEIDLEEIREKIKTLPWVRDAVVKRSFFPNILHIKIEERQVRAIWQLSEKFHPIDTEGNVIDAPFKPSRPILLIVGEEAPEHITELLDFVSSEPEISKRIKVASYISKRRWNIILDDIENGITVKLPEENPDKAWEKLLKLNTTQGILKRKLTIIDLRLEDKVVVKLGKISTKEKEQLRKNKKEQKM
ncbi:MAG: FtsQ-type POTRA domain-containing protein [Alphaproteobacteria bacterium]|nr:FtsQ-type POTRA domain-containing protein [Alphaproteobacteria bacterium]